MAGLLNFLGLGGGGSQQREMPSYNPNQAHAEGLAQMAGAPGASPTSQFLGGFPGAGNMTDVPKRGGGSGVRDFLGKLGDVLLVGNDMAPIYTPRKQQREMGDALAAYLGADDPRLAELIRRDPATGLSVWQATQQKAGDPFTLGEGQVRYGPNGEVLARGPEGGPDVTVIDGIAFDKRTGEPLFESPYPMVTPGPEGEFNEQPRIGLGRPLVQQAQPTVQEPERPAMDENGLPAALTPEQYNATVASLGREKTDAWMQKHGIPIAKTINGKTYYQIGGRVFDNPEGR